MSPVSTCSSPTSGEAVEWTRRARRGLPTLAAETHSANGSLRADRRRGRRGRGHDSVGTPCFANTRLVGKTPPWRSEGLRTPATVPAPPEAPSPAPEESRGEGPEQRPEPAPSPAHCPAVVCLYLVRPPALDCVAMPGPPAAEAGTTA